MQRIFLGGKIKNLRIHDYRNGVKGAMGSYKYIVVSVVSGDLRFILLVIPIPGISMEEGYYVRELLRFVKSLIPIEMVLFAIIPKIGGFRILSNYSSPFAFTRPAPYVYEHFKHTAERIRSCGFVQ